MSSGNKPILVFREGFVKVSVFSNIPEGKDVAELNFRFVRFGKGKTGRWAEGPNYRAGDLKSLELAAKKAAVLLESGGLA